MQINSLGDNLNIIIVAERKFSHDWMSFGLWHSLQKNAPDASVYIQFSGPVMDNLFFWVKKLGVKMARKNLPGKTLLMSPHFVMVRELSNLCVDYFNEIDTPVLNSLLFCSAKEQQFVPFVSYKEGCGTFNLANWINSNQCPYDAADNFMTHNATLNEVKIIQSWLQFGPVYSTISRG